MQEVSLPQRRNVVHIPRQSNRQSVSQRGGKKDDIGSCTMQGAQYGIGESPVQVRNSWSMHTCSGRAKNIRILLQLYSIK